MHVSVFEYRVRGMDPSEWGRVCAEELAPVFAEVPGLRSKIWLRSADGGAGGVYLWEDEAAYRAFLASDLGAGLARHPHIEGLTVRDWAVDEAATAITGGDLQPA